MRQIIVKSPIMNCAEVCPWRSAGGPRRAGAMTEQIRAVLFDWDGTLVNTRTAILAASRTASEKVLGRVFPGTPDEEVQFWNVNGHALPLLTVDEAVRNQIKAVYMQAYTASMAAGVETFAGVPEMLDALRGSGTRIALVTAKERVFIRSEVERAGLADRIDHVVCAEDVSALKPDPEGVLNALAALEVPPEAAVMVGDSPQDILAAAAAGMKGIGVSWGVFPVQALHSAGASAVVDHPAELSALFDSGESLTL